MTTKTKIITLVVALVLALAAVDGMSSSQTPGESAAKRGWWWGQKEPPKADKPEEPKKEERKELQPPPAATQLMEMHPKDLEKMWNEYRDQAVWRPTPEHVRDFYVVQDVIRRKSLAFTAVSGMVMKTTPYLDVSREYPTNNPASEASTRMRDQSISRLLAKNRNNYALIFFTKPGCEWCEVQRPGINYFRDRNGWNIKEVDITRNELVASRFGISFTPAVILIKRESDQWMPVSVGARSVPELEESTYRNVRLLNGEITPDQYYTMDYQSGGVFDPRAPK